MGGRHATCTPAAAVLEHPCVEQHAHSPATTVAATAIAATAIAALCAVAASGGVRRGAVATSGGGATLLAVIIATIATGLLAVATTVPAVTATAARKEGKGTG